MFRVVEELPEDLRRFVTEPNSVTLPFRFADDDVGTAIIQIAAGKAPADLLPQRSALDAISLEDLRPAAQGFVAKVMLATGSDLFTVLGVSSAGELIAYRDNYRRLMAMVHPDARPTGFPPDAAIRVNHAYAVLSDPEQLENYKTQHVAQHESSPSGVVGLAAAGAGIRAQQKPRPAADGRFASRVGALLFRARERGLLLWLALLLLVPLGSAFYLMLSENPHVRLVEARSKLATSQATGLLAPPVPSALTAPVAPVIRAEKSEKTSPESAQNSATRKQPPEPALRPSPPPAAQTTPTLAFETSQSLSRLATLIQPASTPPPASPAPPLPATKGTESQTPTPSMEGTQTRTSPTSTVDIAPAVSSAPSVARPETVIVEKPQPLVATVAPAKTLAVETHAPVATAVSTPVTYRLRSVDVEDVLTRFSNAYETGSLSAFDQVLAPGLPGRSQLLVDYGRVFQVTRNRSIRFIQLKHAPAGERMATRGYAVVTTTDQEDRVSKQRVYLELEIGIDHNVPRIERISNYVVN